MNLECICSYIVNNANQIMTSLRNRNQQQFCDETGCYEDS